MARFLENITRSGDLRFVDADQIAAITAAYIRCDLDGSDVGRLPAPRAAPRCTTPTRSTRPSR